jgi:hypothetical protein
MKRGRWLYHPDQYRPQNPVFQVKKAAVRVTAYIEGGEPRFQLLVGDNPDDPTAKWVDVRLNSDDMRLTPPTGSANPVTQAVFAEAGWYRLDVSGLAGTQSMVWAEDEEGTLDDTIKPVHLIRPGCGGGDTPPPITDPIPVTCAEVHALLNSGGLQPGAWYALSDVSPTIATGQVVYLRAMGPAQLSQSGWFYGPGLTDVSSGNQLWPVVVQDVCTMIELWDTFLNNRVVGSAAIAAWLWGFPWLTDNTVIRSIVAFRAKPCTLTNNTFVDSYVTLWSHNGSTLDRNEFINSTVTVYRSPTGANPYVDFRNCRLFNSYVYVADTPYGYIERCILDNAYVNIQRVNRTELGGNFRFTHNHVRTSNVYLNIDGLYPSFATAIFERMDLEDSTLRLLSFRSTWGPYVSGLYMRRYAYVSMRDVSRLTNVVVADYSAINTSIFDTTTPNQDLITLSEVTLRDRASLTWVDTGAYPGYGMRCSLADTEVVNSRVYLLNTPLTFSGASLTRCRAMGTGPGSTTVQFRLNITDSELVGVTMSLFNNNDQVIDVSASRLHETGLIVFNSRLLINNVSTDNGYVQPSYSYITLVSSRVANSSQMRFYGTTGTLGQIDLAARSTISMTNTRNMYLLSVSLRRAYLDVTSSSVPPLPSLQMRQVDVTGATLRITMASNIIATMTTSTFSTTSKVHTFNYTATGSAANMFVYGAISTNRTIPPNIAPVGGGVINF